ncbi:MAG: FIST signal transduction protein [Candidatus Zixiibacteriota bacterium]
MIKNAYSTKSQEKDAVAEIKEQFENQESKLILFFASSSYEPIKIAKQMKYAFPDAEVMGCTTAGEITSGKMLDNSLVAMSFDEDVIEDIIIEPVRSIDSVINIPEAFGKFENYYGKSMMELDFKEYVGIILVDGLRVAEEEIMEIIGEQTKVQFIGGSAGDDLKFKKTHVFVNGEAITNAAALALIKPSCDFDILKTQSLEPMETKFKITEADEDNREVIQFDGEDAVFAYANALEQTKQEIQDSFMSHPVGVMVDGEPYVRSPKILNGNNLRFYCKIYEGMEVTLLKSRDIVIDTKKDLERKIKKFGRPQGIVNFNCILRTLELKQKKQTEQYAKLFEKIPTIGFSTYGEEYIGHINQTATMLLFKSNKKAA